MQTQTLKPFLGISVLPNGIKGVSSFFYCHPLFSVQLNSMTFRNYSFPKVQNWLQSKMHTEVDGYLMFVEFNQAVFHWFAVTCQEKNERPLNFEGGHVHLKS